MTGYAPQDELESDFRLMNWGMTQDEVLESEEADPHLVMPGVIMS